MISSPVSSEPASRRWRPSPLVGSAAALHAGVFATIAIQPATIPWALGSVAASHLLLMGAGLLPRSGWLGPNLRRLPEALHDHVALTFDDGPDPALTPRVLDLLDRHGAQATFFCIGMRARQHPGLVREIARRGHSVENHSLSHRHHFSLFGPRRLTQEIADAQALLSDLTGTAPRFFRAPAGFRNPFLEPVLCRQGLHLASWTRRGFDSVRRGDPDRVTARLLHGLAGRDILLMHDGNAGRDHTGHPLILTVLPRVLLAMERAGLRCSPLQSD